jgi:ELWxxDGT repeat protein
MRRVVGLISALSCAFTLVSAAEDVGPAHRLKAVNLEKLTVPTFGSAFVQVGTSGDRAYFAADDGAHGRELWTTDGTAAGTHLVKDINPGQENSFPAGMVDRAGTLFFVADDGVHGSELWKSDGTEAGTALVKDIRPGAESSLAYIFREFNGMLLLFADGGAGVQLWKSDGTESGTVLLKDIYPLYLGFLEFRRAIYFDAADAIHGTEMWRTDGTPEGTVLADVHPDGIPRHAFPMAVVVNDALLFVGEDDIHGQALWRTDGTAAGTTFVKDIDPAPPYFPFWWAPMAEAAGTFYFAASDLAHGPQLYKTDGTAGGTVMVKDISPGALWTDMSAAVLADGALFFGASDIAHGTEPWRSDGTADGTFLVKDVNPVADFSWPGVARIFGVRGAALFRADDGAHGVELWRSDGTESGTARVQDIVPGPSGSFPDNFISFGNWVLFAAAGEPWVGRAEILLNRPEQALVDLREEVQSLGLQKARERRLLARLESAAKAVEGADARSAVRALEQFMREVEVESPRWIPQAAAGELLDFAQDIENLLTGAYAGS